MEAGWAGWRPWGSLFGVKNLGVVCTTPAKFGLILRKWVPGRVRRRQKLPGEVICLTPGGQHAFPHARGRRAAPGAFGVFLVQPDIYYYTWLDQGFGGRNSKNVRGRAARWRSLGGKGGALGGIGGRTPSPQTPPTLTDNRVYMSSSCPE